MQVERRINGSLSSKLYGFEKVLSPLVARACISVCPKNAANFNVDNVRVVKIAGGGVGDSKLVHGVVRNAASCLSSLVFLLHLPFPLPCCY